MAQMLSANNVSTTLAVAIGTSSINLTVATGTGALFPALSGGNYFWATLQDPITPSTREVVQVTAVSGDVLTVTRGQDGFSAASFGAGAIVEMRDNAAKWNNTPQLAGTQTFSGTNTFSNTATFNGSVALNGTSTGVTQSYGDNTTNLATTAFVDRLRDVPQNSQTASYTLALTDRGKSIDTTAGVIVPANSSVAFPVGSVVSIYNNSGSSITISITTDTMYLAGTATTGSRTLAQHGMATLRKVLSTTWVIAGSGVS